MVESRIVYMSNLWRTEKMNDTCREMIPSGMMNSAFTVFGTVMAACRSLLFVD